MHIRVSRVRRGEKTFEYAQLVESYRREDGMPAHRIVHSFGRVDETLLANLRAAFRGAKDGQQLEPVPRTALPKHVARPQAALRYLDIAVLLEVFTQVGLDKLLAQLGQDDGSEVPDHKIIAALMVQRCVAPDSKLAATRWFPTTALPELLAVAPEQFNNTRIHRVLERLEDMTQELQRAVASQTAKISGAFATLYMDITDTWFVGTGPEMAALGKTKEGMLRRKIGILLLCNEHGYPLHWEVLQGRYGEAPAMLDMVRQLRHVPWLSSVPVVCDRAMGHTAYVRDLAATGVRFITALATPEMQTYCPQLEALTKPLDTLGATSEQQLEDTAKSAVERLLQGGAMRQVNDTLLVLDAGVTELSSAPQPAPNTSNADAPGDALRAALDATEAVTSGRCSSYADAFRLLRLDPASARNLRRLATLQDDLQQRLLAGEAAGLSAFTFAKIAALSDPQQQRAAFEAALLRARRTTPPVSAAKTRSRPPTNLPQVRVIVSFNPDVFASQRLTAHRNLEAIRQAVVELNAQLASSRCAITPNGVARRIDELLRRKDMLQAFQVDINSVTIDGKDRFQVDLTLDEQDWKQRRRTDGFSVFVAHPELQGSAEHICLTYRAKDAVETDFRVIKSQVQLRPIRHRTDLKVRAHVNLCMLALLLERTLRQRLARSASSFTAESALELLEPLRLCHFPAKNGKDTYLPTQPTNEQSRLLRALKLSHLVDPDQLAAQLTPRPPVVTTNESETA